MGKLFFGTQHRSLALFSFAAICTLGFAQPAMAQNELSSGARQVAEQVEDFYDLYRLQLQSVLKTRLIQEKEYIDEIVELVRNEEIPKSVVDQAWLWVRSKRPYTNAPFVYFQRVLRRLKPRRIS